MSQVSNYRISIGTRDEHISNITIDTDSKQFRGFVTDAEGNMAIRFIDFTSDLGSELLDVIKTSDYTLYDLIMKGEHQ